jgi:hypothetical protein
MLNMMIMFIFLAKIQPSTTKRDIVNFISPVLKGGLFATKGILENIEINVLQDSCTNTTEYHAIVQVAPDKAALRVIHQLNRKKLNGKPINVRPYYIRNRKNDPRLKNQYPVLKIKQKRLDNRRRDYLEMLIKQETIKFEGDAQYARRMLEK